MVHSNAMNGSNDATKMISMLISPKAIINTKSLLQNNTKKKKMVRPSPKKLSSPFHEQLTKMFLEETSCADFPESSSQIIFGFWGDFLTFTQCREEIQRILKEDEKEFLYELYTRSTSSPLILLTLQLRFFNTRTPDYGNIILKLRFAIKDIFHHLSSTKTNTNAIIRVPHDAHIKFFGSKTNQDQSLDYSRDHFWFILDTDQDFMRIDSEIELLGPSLLSCDPYKGRSSQSPSLSILNTSNDNRNRTSLLSIRSLSQLIGNQLQLSEGFSEICLMSNSKIYQDIVKCGSDFYFVL